VSGSRTSRRAFVTAGAGRGGSSREVDAVVVGAGYAGPRIAKELAEEGRRVLVLEAGPSRSGKDLYSSMIWARRLHGPYYASSAGSHTLGIGANVGWGLGGSGVHHFALWPRLHPEDFEIRSRFGRGLDWPIGYDDVRPYYDRVQEDIGVSGDAEAEVWRPPGAPYPLPPLPIPTHGQILQRGFDALGLRTAPSPSAILSRPYRGRPACEFDGWCMAGCAIGALGHPLATLIPAARRAGVRFQTGAHVTRVLTKGGRATGVEFADRHGRRHVQRARLVVLAAYSVEIPRILLNSAEGGLANSSGLVGRYMAGHVQTTAYGLFPEQTEVHRGTIGGRVLCQDMYDKQHDPGFFGGYQIIAGAAAKPNDLIVGIASTRADINGANLDPFLRRASEHLASLTIMGFSTPQRDNGLTLVDQLDPYGMRRAALVHTFDADAVRLSQSGSAKCLEILRAAGAEEAWAGQIGTSHILGGTIMGDDPSSSVTNSFGQTHDVENLFVAGASLFPGCGAVNPTFTLNALGLRTSEFINGNWRALT
jgi:choline dehydrogenase-like flavoprotein